ncbi:MAG TPA: HEAT repeat domain-containing protein [Gemmatimonadales bacterium]|nr:HEAT repeat domain-containing protein [Gemmatimonadales bacterium]
MPEVLSTHAVSTAASLAAMLLLLRDQRGRREQQVLAFRAFLSELGAGGLDLRVTDGGMTVEGIPVPPEAPGAEQLATHLRGHGIGRLRFPPGLTPASVLSVLRTLAMPAGHFVRLEQLVEDIDPATRALVHIAPPADPESMPEALPSGFISDMDFMSAAKGPAVGADALRYSQLSYVPAGRLASLLAEVREAPASAAAVEQLNQIVAACDVARRNGELEHVFRAAVDVAALEAGIEDEELRRHYHIALRRMLPREALDYVARRTVGPQRTDAIDVLRHVGAEASESLLHLLVDSDSMEERRAYRSALRTIATVSPLLGRLLGHEEWYVIRNVAELCGDLRAEHTVPQLARHVDHEDERVRRAVAGALAKIASPAAVEPLRQMLRDPSPQVRLLAVQGLDGPRARGLAMTLALALEDETNGDVQRELLLALGRIGTPDAVQALARQAAPARLFQRRSVSMRLAAVEGLRLAGTPAAIHALQGLAKDDEGEVRRTVQLILEGLKPDPVSS